MTDRDKSLFKLNEKKVAKYEARTQGTILPTIVEEGSNRSVRRLLRLKAIQESPKPGKSKSPISEGNQIKRMRSSEGEERVTKTPKPSISFRFAIFWRSSCQITVIDRSDPDGRMMIECWPRLS